MERATGIEPELARFGKSLAGRRLWSQLLMPKELQKLIGSTRVLLDPPASTEFVEK